MLENFRKILYDLGLSEIQIQIYEYILTHNFGTIDDIKNELRYSYSQVHYNLSELEEMGLIFSSTSEKKNKYYKIRPKVALTRLFEKKYETHTSKIETLDEHVRAFNSDIGRCVKTISFYHYDDINLAIENYYNLIQNARKEIIMSSLPPYLIKKLEGVLYDAFMKGIDITLFFSKEDFLEIKDYFEKITDILSRVSLKIIEIEEKTCQNVRYNDIIVNSGLILIDEAYFNSILFKDDEIFHFDGFFSSNFVEMSKKMLKIKTVKKNVKLDYPTYVNNVLETLKEKRAFKTDELSKETKIGGSKLKEILDFLVNEGKVERYSSSEGRGRPAIYYSLIENNNKK